jgi:hypothetical protein
MKDESVRIDQGMRAETFTVQTPGAEGIALAADAPALAEPFSTPATGRLLRPRRARGTVMQNPPENKSGGSQSYKWRNSAPRNN